VERAILLKYLLTRVGRLLSAKAIWDLNASMNYLESGRWMHANGYDVNHRVDYREQLFDLAASQVAEREVLYMEFGVFQGAATRSWSKLLRNPKSKLHGFDSFEGLPENWVHPKGHFSVGGQVPQIDDDRVQFFKGWFEETLPSYKFPSHEVLVVVLDADLYSSTNFVLNKIEDMIVPGTYIYFDEFNHQFDELRAFDEFIKRTGMKFSLVGATRSLAHVMFQRCG
jgi:hypothetical protein